MNYLKQLMERIDALELRERGLLLLVVLVVLYSAWDRLLMAPLDGPKKLVIKQLEQTKNSLKVLNDQAQNIVLRGVQDLDKNNREQLATLRQQLDAIEGELKRTANVLIPSDRMAKLLENVLVQSQGLTLTSLEGLGASPFVDEDEGKKKDKPSAGSLGGVYKHGLKITFKGGYLDTLDYLHALEQLPWSFFWDSLDYEVESYPDGHSTITVYTLSLGRNWIGV